MYAIHRQAAPPSGVAFSLSARLTPSCLQGTSTSTSKIVRNLVTATNDFLQLFEVVEEVVDSNAGRSDAVNGKLVTPEAETEQSEQMKPSESNGETQVSLLTFLYGQYLHCSLYTYAIQSLLDICLLMLLLACFLGASVKPSHALMYLQ